MPRIIRSNGQDGNNTISTPTTLTRIESSAVGSSGGQTLTASNVNFAAGQIVFIYRARGTTNIGLFEYNQILAYDHGLSQISLAYPLERDYGNTGAEKSFVVVSPSWATYDISATLKSAAWDGQLGGMLEIRALRIIGSGDVDQRGLGYRGGTGVNGSGASGKQGEGTAGAHDTTSTAANGNGGGGGQGNGGGSRGSSGGGGGNRTAGGVGNNSAQPFLTPGQPGAAVGSDSDQSVIMGGGGGSGGGSTVGGGSEVTGNGGRGGGCFVWITEVLSWTGRWLLDGNNGGNASRDGLGGGGAGAAGTGYVEATNINSPGLSTALGGTGGIEGGFPNALQGGYGSVGRYKLKVCATPTIAATPVTLNNVGGHDYCQSFVHIMGE